MTKKQKAALVVADLAKEYPDATCSLQYLQPYQLLIAVRLAAQCTDARVNIVTAVLFDKYPTLWDIAQQKWETIADIVRPCGLGNTKARDIVAACNMLINDFDSTVPNDMEKLLSIPGVGRKSANLILGDVYGLPAIVCDTHCIRITNLLGLTSSKNADIVEKQLRPILSPKDSNDFCHRLVLHGRAVCKARSPECEKCCVNKFCSYYNKTT